MFTSINQNQYYFRQFDYSFTNAAKVALKLNLFLG